MKKLVISLSKAEHEEFEQAAKEHGIALHEWAKRKLRGVLPPAPAVMNEAFRLLDVSDRMRELSGKPVPPPAELPEQRLVQLGKRLPSSHSCLNHASLVREDGGPPNVCAAPAQFGRPCYWASSGAMDCHHFTPRFGR